MSTRRTALKPLPGDEDPRLTVKRTPIPLADRFWPKVAGPWYSGVDEDCCWLWLGARSRKFGYGVISSGRRGDPQLRATRVAHQLANGPLAPDLVIAHSCDTPLCCNPRHLRAVPQIENVHEMMRKGRGRGQFTSTQTRRRRRLTIAS